MTTVLPCPFCAHDDVEIDEIELRCYAVCCPECGCIGPVTRTNTDGAITAWNKAPRETDDIIEFELNPIKEAS